MRQPCSASLHGVKLQLSKRLIFLSEKPDGRPVKATSRKTMYKKRRRTTILSKMLDYHGYAGGAAGAPPTRGLTIAQITMNNKPSKIKISKALHI
jgi:hypothetical protein